MVLPWVVGRPHLAVGIDAACNGIREPVQGHGLEDGVQGRIVVRPLQKLLPDPGNVVNREIQASVDRPTKLAGPADCWRARIRWCLVGWRARTRKHCLWLQSPLSWQPPSSPSCSAADQRRPAQS